MNYLYVILGCALCGCVLGPLLDWLMRMAA